MTYSRRVSKRDKTHEELVRAMKNRMGGYWRDENGAHHAFLLGLPVAAYDMHKAGAGFPDWIVYVSWVAVGLEIKNPEGRGGGNEKRRDFYTEPEREFMAHFPGIRRTCMEQNEIYGALLEIAHFVLDAEDVMARELSEAYRQVLLPKLMIADEAERTPA